MTTRALRHLAAALAAASALALLTSAPALGATPSPSPCPSIDPNATALPSPGTSQSCIDAAKAQQAALKEIQATLGSTLASGLAAQQQLSESILQNQKQQDDLRNLIAQAQARIAELDAEGVRLDAEIAATQLRVDRERKEIRELARVVYTQPDSMLVILAQSASLGDLVTRVSDLMAAGSRADELKHQLDADLQKVHDDRAKVAADRAETVAQQDAERSGLDKLQQLRVQEEQSAAELADKLAQTRDEIQAASKQSSDLAKKITEMLQQQEEAIIAAAMQQVWDQYEAWSKANPVVASTTSTGHSKQYRFIWPEPQAQITQGFGPSTLWFEPPYAGAPHFHMGIDLAAPQGTHVLAADDGVVALVGSGTTGYGNYVVIAHQGGFTTLYGHLEAALVHPGDQVTQGEVIGFEGSTGYSTGPHVHFELRINGAPQDPAPYLPPGPSDFKG
ncbi:MAG TPA: peptidoglycan DD-metalloendopeptidase family protein [Candidatus Dormibacteraeota bacterium]